MISILIRIVSITFMVISINYLLRAGDMSDYVVSGVLLLFGIYFSIKSSKDKRENFFDICPDKKNILVKKILSIATLISYGILVLSIVHLIKGDENSLNVLIVSLLITIGGLASYWSICRKNKEIQERKG